MVRWSALALAALALIGVAFAQTTQSYSLGRKDAGQVHESRLTARNANCTQPLDIRFEFAQSPWLRPQGENVVRGVPSGESRALPIIIDLTQVEPGTHTAQVDVVCENCRGLIFANCRFDRQRLLISVEATAPPPAEPVPATRTPPPTRAPVITAPAPQTPPPETPPTTVPTPAPVETAESAPACDCGAAVGLWQGVAAFGGVLALAGLGWGAMSSAATRTARAAMEEATRTAEQGKRFEAKELAVKALERKLDEAEAAAERAADELEALAQAQAQAMRVLNGVGQAGDNAAEADAWTARAAVAGHFVNEAAGRVVPDKGEGRLSRVLEASRGKHGGATTVFATFGPEGERAQIDWLIANGFAFSDIQARAILSEMTNWRAHHAMGDMIARLDQKIEARNRAGAEARALKAQVLALDHGV